MTVPAAQSPMNSAPVPSVITGTGLWNPVRNGTAVPVTTAPDPVAEAAEVSPTRRTTPFAHSATTADVPTVGPSSPVTMGALA